jgi:hypothetical protein
MFDKSIEFVNSHILYLNSNKFFAGVVMILLNIGSRFVTINLSKSSEQYLKMAVTKQLLVFAMAWMGTRDIYYALSLTAIFTILSDYAFNDESPYCCVPEKYRVLNKMMDTNNDGVVSEAEINNAVEILERAKKDKNKQQLRQQFMLYGNYMGAPGGN